MGVDNVPPLDISNFNITLAVLGGWLSLFGFVGFLLKEKYYLPEALISVLAGLVFSPHATNWIRPLEYALGSQENLDTITLYFCRLALDIQLVIAGIQLPAKYFKKEWKSLFVLLGPGMVAMWVSTSLIVWALVPHLNFVHALAVASCVTPTDPVLSNSIVKGKFADKHVPKDLQNLIISESGTNDGLGYPFLFIALYLIKYSAYGGAGETGGARKALGYWFGITWGYEILMSVLYGIVVAFLFRKALQFAQNRGWVDRESFLVFAISLALFICGTGGMLGTDDVLASFIAGNVFTWDGWFSEQTKDDSFQATIDYLINIAIFGWFGAVCPWSDFNNGYDIIPIYRLIFIGVLVMLFRRLPFVIIAQKGIHQIRDWRQCFFTGFFGPIGVSGIFYLYASLEFFQTITIENGEERPDIVRLGHIMRVVVWFMAITSIVVHGLSIPLAKLLFQQIPRTLSGLSSENNSFHTRNVSSSFHIRNGPSSGNISRHSTFLAPFRALTKSKTADKQDHARPIYKIGGSIIDDTDRGNRSLEAGEAHVEKPEGSDDTHVSTDVEGSDGSAGSSTPNPSKGFPQAMAERRAIKFPGD